jgi:hypothetical protein
VPYTLEPIYDMTVLGPEVYAGNPALKLPILRAGTSVLFGAQNICRAIAERAEATKRATPARVVWPEELRDDLSRNAQELVWHCSAAQIQLVMGTVINSLPADNPFFTKARTGFGNSLQWLDQNLAACLRTLPPRDLSLFEVSLYCLIDHLVFRPTLPVDPFGSLMAFSKEFGERPAARRTVYRFDKR